MLVWDLLLFTSLIDRDQKYNKCNIINRSHNINVGIKIIQPIKSSGRGYLEEREKKNIGKKNAYGDYYTWKVAGRGGGKGITEMKVKD